MKLQTLINLLLGIVGMSLISSCGPINLNPTTVVDPPTTPPINKLRNDDVEKIQVKKVVTPIDDLLHKIDDQSENEISVCLHYVTGHGHSCDSAIYDIDLNGVNAGEVNLNNGSGREVTTTISGTTRNVTYRGSVPGTTFSGHWKTEVVEDKKVSTFDLKPNCNSPKCTHSGLVFYSFIGHITVENNGSTQHLYLITKSDQSINDGDHVLFELNKFKTSDPVFRLTTTKHKFGDYCTLDPDTTP